ncbi:hypothetical protein [Heyndrickxia oleronia]
MKGTHLIIPVGFGPFNIVGSCDVIGAHR